MKVGEIMTRGVEIASPDDTVQQAASRMAAPSKGNAVGHQDAVKLLSACCQDNPVRR
jgi:CBS domain-containing protein